MPLVFLDFHCSIYYLELHLTPIEVSNETPIDFNLKASQQY